MHFPLLHDILIILGLSVIIVFILGRFKLPSVLGFLITGVIIGPGAFALIGPIEEVETMSEIGIILLLFVIGMELSLSIRSELIIISFFNHKFNYLKL